MSQIDLNSDLVVFTIGVLTLFGLIFKALTANIIARIESNTRRFEQINTDRVNDHAETIGKLDQVLNGGTKTQILDALKESGVTDTIKKVNGGE